MAHLTVITGNRLEVLAERLADIAAQPLEEPLAPDLVVVQSKGMESWIRMALARINGICANMVFPFPRAFLEDIFKKCFPEFIPPYAFDPEVMTFRIMKHLKDRIGEPVFEPLSTYLGEGGDRLKRYGISRKISHLFDQYPIFRPDMVFSWESGQESDWQAVLWRDLMLESPNRHPAFWMRQLVEKIREGRIRLDIHFHRVCVFGISYLPPVYLQIMAEISRQVPVYLFLMNPCREYWSEIVSDYEAQRIRSAYPEPIGSGRDFHMERGNRLLSAWGVQGRQFFSTVNTLEASVEELFQEPDGNTLLSRIQRDILTLTDPETAAGVGRAVPGPVKSDRSIWIHACHSPMREMEVLRDLILDLFESEPEITPQDILVMTPEIETYAPFIQAVFGTQSEGNPRIPFRIADRGIGMEDEAVEAFLSILSLYNTRLGASQLLGILEYAPIRHRFNLSEAEVRTIERWIRETRIRWGVNSEDRNRWGIPGFMENTWEAGLDRLLLGYAMIEEGEKDVAGVLPYGAVSGEFVKTLEKFFTFFDTTVIYYNNYYSINNIDSWIALINQLLHDFMEMETSASQGIFAIEDAIHHLGWVGTQSGFEEKVDFPVVRSYLEERLKRKTEGHRFASEGMTFCTLLPMRSIPAQVICMVGMNDGAYPGQDHPLTFDKMAMKPRAGDRSRRRDDKYLFLEALLSARRRLFISYVGLNIQDNTVIPPSVLVTQLLDYIRDGYGIPETDLVVHHRLHPFSPAYFQNHPVLFSYSEDDFLAAKEGQRLSAAQSPFIEFPLDAPDEAFAHPDLEVLCRFFSNTSAFFLKNRLGVYLSEGEQPLLEREPFGLDGLETYRMAQDLVEAHLKGLLPENVHRIWHLEGRLPHGNVGLALFHRLNQDVAKFSRKVKELCGHEKPEEFSGEIHFDNLTLSGKVGSVCQGRLIRYRYVNTQGKDLLDSWIRHLFLAAVSTKKSGETLYFCKEALFRFHPVREASFLLESLLNLYREGLLQPVLLFPQSSFEYARQRFYKGRSREEALQGAKTKWTGNEFAAGDALDPYIERCFRGVDPIGTLFEQYAETVFAPLFAHLEKRKS